MRAFFRPVDQAPERRLDAVHVTWIAGHGMAVFDKQIPPVGQVRNDKRAAI